MRGKKYANHLSEDFERTPTTAKMLLTGVELLSTMNATGGAIRVEGQRYDIQSRYLGAGTYRVTLAAETRGRKTTP